MTNPMICARIGCEKPASYDKPLCYPHWKEFDRFEIFECEKCRRFDEMVGEFSEEEDLCWDCIQGREVPVSVHAPIERQTRYLYILKLDGGDFYVGQTNDLELRLGEHRDGKSPHTAGKHPRLVWFERRVGDRDELNADEAHLTLLAKENPRAIRRVVAEWRRPLKLVDLEA